jgi:hypothetical protein
VSSPSKPTTLHEPARSKSRRDTHGGIVIDYRCDGGSFPVIGSCVTILDPKLISSSKKKKKGLILKWEAKNALIIMSLMSEEGRGGIFIGKK